MQQKKTNHIELCYCYTIIHWIYLYCVCVSVYCRKREATKHWNRTCVERRIRRLNTRSFLFALKKASNSSIDIPRRWLFNTYLFCAASFDTFHFMKMIQSIRIQYFHFFHRWFSKSTIWFIRQTTFMFWIPWITFQHLVNITFWSEPLFTVYRCFCGRFSEFFQGQQNFPLDFFSQKWYFCDLKASFSYYWKLRPYFWKSRGSFSQYHCWLRRKPITLIIGIEFKKIHHKKIQFVF